MLFRSETLAGNGAQEGNRTPDLRMTSANGWNFVGHQGAVALWKQMSDTSGLTHDPPDLSGDVRWMFDDSEGWGFKSLRARFDSVA